MADANLKARPPVTERFVTVQQSRRENRSRNWHLPFHRRTEPPLYPWLKLAGRWIEHAGFEAGQRVKINVEHGRLTITTE
ncbi:SymE family type I addiction module toxin [Caballeronia sp. LZ008]|uniref:SymE family type I addiction module toxin n=1 Tax=unclassified Caballeronia TaxID=2646786 RepID=UPI00202831D1|nr:MULTISPECIES: SymE family type I addiction module toxin [unclassified Caballeronia]MDR5795671.1 SymE family type I addiction module toxin [Caballeronia sp. LZ008]